ncbi:2-C-methyl-D-erythritol 4-phosphate cytidylyltransferase [Bacillus sp. B1-b2]|uniref:2-C-methyl-D-erythritol 4-phosphate cytidylyltransferase n=1 Tax=Bacillus sp. B1-b2 TaxID=2653201 RepID=UPI001261B0F0|nr:2-C-methyl-D-erythritol 4-phosphate cytidylyltransferase [Bacillus sp. B1-b2]KAB7666115.1 2-C-methyl-D-erythritol 4-phosphate cytidylyltransferase [Bacillus sp. B1-b2]
MAYEVIIPAAGQGKRMGVGKNKLFLEIDGIPVFIHTLQVFEEDNNCQGIWLVVSPQDKEEMHQLLEKYEIKKIQALVEGGKERQHSVYHAVKRIKNNSIVLVHDAARPFIQIEQLEILAETAKESGAAVLAVPIKDTVKKVQGDLVVETVERSSLWAIQTPQAFRISILKEAHEKAELDTYVGTDDASLIERLGFPVRIIEGNYDNIKLTTPEDLYFAEAILAKKSIEKMKIKE